MKDLKITTEQLEKIEDLITEICEELPEKMTMSQEKRLEIILIKMNHLLNTIRIGGLK